jgi:hypothetical protein
MVSAAIRSGRRALSRRARFVRSDAIRGVVSPATIAYREFNRVKGNPARWLRVITNRSLRLAISEHTVKFHLSSLYAS